MKSDYITRAKHFIELFFHDLNPYTTSLGDMRLYTDYFNLEHNRNVLFRHGATRYAFITSDYVVKVDYKNDARWAGNCEDEYNLYQRIKDSDMSYLFAEITRFHFEDTNFYIMPRINNNDPYANFEIEDFLNEEEIDFVYEELGVHDIHVENFGFKNNEPVIFDYAYHE